MTTNKIQKLGGASAILESLIYISAFIVYGGILVYPEVDAGVQERFNFLSEHYVILSIFNLIIYVLFGVLLAVLVQAIHMRLKTYAPESSKFSSIFGYLWVGMVIASGMITNIALNSVIDIGLDDPEKAMLIWSSISIITEGLGGGNEIVGGVWVLSISIIAFKGKIFSKGLTYLGIIVGLAGILSVYPLDIFKEIFGVSQIFWFIWIGIVLIRTR